jgi:hypothetical protein
MNETSHFGITIHINSRCRTTHGDGTERIALWFYYVLSYDHSNMMAQAPSVFHAYNQGHNDERSHFRDLILGCVQIWMLMELVIP